MIRRLVSDLITGKVHSLPGNASVLKAAHLMKDFHIGAVLIVEEGRLRGIFTERDALCRVITENLNPGETPLAGVMTADPKTAPPKMTTMEALLMMRDGKFRHLPVVEDGQVKGIISMRDFIGAEFHEVEAQLEFAQLLESDLQ